MRLKAYLPRLLQRLEAGQHAIHALAGRCLGCCGPGPAYEGGERPEQRSIGVHLNAALSRPCCRAKLPFHGSHPRLGFPNLLVWFAGWIIPIDLQMQSEDAAGCEGRRADDVARKNANSALSMAHIELVPRCRRGDSRCLQWTQPCTNTKHLIHETEGERENMSLHDRACT